ncbi:TerC family protein [Bdellovibrionota bacterium FG-1]
MEHFSFVIAYQDLLLILFLAFLEGILSIDNAVVLAMMARHLPLPLQRRALTYGLAGSVVFRLAALALATHLIRWNWVKAAGGAYLLYVAISHLWRKPQESNEQAHQPYGFWRTVFLIEVMDIAFAVDSILAAVAVTPKFWLIFTGGMLGVVMIRFAANAFLGLLKRFPGFETSAYLLIFVIGIKLCVDWLHLPGVRFESPSQPAFWIFWGLMGLCFGYGFFPKKSPQTNFHAPEDCQPK